MFYVGQKVAYLGGLIGTKYGETLPQEDRTYTIREIRDFGIGIGMHLHEIKNPSHLYSPENRIYEAYFHARFFRPLVERKTSIEIFTKMPAPSREKEAV